MKSSCGGGKILTQICISRGAWELPVWRVPNHTVAFLGSAFPDPHLQGWAGSNYFSSDLAVGSFLSAHQCAAISYTWTECLLISLCFSCWHSSSLPFTAKPLGKLDFIHCLQFFFFSPGTPLRPSPLSLYQKALDDLHMAESSNKFSVFFVLNEPEAFDWVLCSLILETIGLASRTFLQLLPHCVECSRALSSEPCPFLVVSSSTGL